MCDEFEVPARSRKKAEKIIRDRIDAATRFGIPYVPGRGMELEMMPRILVTPCERRARPSHVPFESKSPKGTMHGRHSTSTNPKKYCTYDHAVLQFPHDGTLSEQLRNLDTVLYVCTDDIEYRSDARSSEYQDASNAAFIRDTKRILVWFLSLLKAVAIRGYNVGPYLDRLRVYTASYEHARAQFLSASERKRTLNYDSEKTEMTPIKMRAFD